MPSFDDARILILRNVRPVGVESAFLLEALGRVVAEDIVAPWDLPMYDNSAMDGFAVRVADCRQTSSLPITGYLAAGAPPGATLEAGTAIKIMTGAPIPEGCDAVIPFEEAEEINQTVRPTGTVRKSQHIRFAAEDVRRGEVVIGAGTVVRPAEINMLASLGLTSVPVYRKPRVAILSTGDELVEPGQALAPGKIINSNALSLAAAVREAGGEPELLGIARDTIESHREKLSKGLEADALITSAGVSTGDRDLVRDVLAEFGVEQVFWRVDVRPGGPTAFGLKNGKPIFCLPGNPVATMLIFDAFVRPALLKMMGHSRVLRRPVSAILREPAHKKLGKVRLLRVRLTRDGETLLAHSSGDQNTGMLTTMLHADGYAILAADRMAYAAGDQVEVQLLTDELNAIAADG